MRHKQVSMATLGFVADHPPLLPTFSPFLPRSLQSQPPLFLLPNLIPSSFILSSHSPLQHFPHSVPPPPLHPPSIPLSRHTKKHLQNNKRETRGWKKKRKARQTSQLDLVLFHSTSRCFQFSSFFVGKVVKQHFIYSC